MPTQLMTHKAHPPSKLNHGMIKSLSTIIAQGNYANVACQLCGIGQNTFYTWLNQGESDLENGIEDTLHSKLVQSIKEAQAKAESEMVTFIVDTSKAKKDPYAAMMFLERRHPDRWGKRDKVEINNNQNITLTYKQVIELARQAEAEIDSEQSRTIIEGEAKELPP